MLEPGDLFIEREKERTQKRLVISLYLAVVVLVSLCPIVCPDSPVCSSIKAVAVVRSKGAEKMENWSIVKVFCLGGSAEPSLCSAFPSPSLSLCPFLSLSLSLPFVHHSIYIRFLCIMFSFNGIRSPSHSLSHSSRPVFRSRIPSFLPDSFPLSVLSFCF